jgi:hypothetical protein
MLCRVSCCKLPRSLGLGKIVSIGHPGVCGVQFHLCPSSRRSGRQPNGGCRTPRSRRGRLDQIHHRARVPQLIIDPAARRAPETVPCSGLAQWSAGTWGVISFDNEHALIGRTRITIRRLATGLLLEAGRPQRGQRRPLAKRVRRADPELDGGLEVGAGLAGGFHLAVRSRRSSRGDHSAGDTAPLGRSGGRTGASHLPLGPQHPGGQVMGRSPHNRPAAHAVVEGA